ncbi:MAG: RNA polymerase sigma factor [Bacteroidota bacterium]
MTAQKQAAFMKAYDGCHDAFVRYCSALAYGKMDTEDLVQDVLLSAYTHFEKIEKKGQFLHYLIRAARNRSVSKWRKAKFQTALLEKHTERLEAQGVSPDLALDIQILYKTMDRLPEHQKDALILFEITGFSMKEIANIQGSTEGAVKTKISRARKRLRQLMEGKSTQNAITPIFSTLQTVTL